MTEEDYVLEYLQAELSEGMFEKNMVELETKHSIGKQLVIYPNLVGKVNKVFPNEDHYYSMFAEMFPKVEEAIDKLGWGKTTSWTKIKNYLKQMKDTRVLQGQKKAQEILDNFNHDTFTENQLKCLQRRADGLTLQQIADEQGTTRQYISESILKAIKKAYAKNNGKKEVS